MSEILTPAQVGAAGLADWRQLFHALQTRYATGDFATGLALLTEIGRAAEEADHHPDLDLRYGHLNVRLYSHDAGGVTRRDLRLAQRISELAAARGVVAVPQLLSAAEVALDTPDRARVEPFWRAVLAEPQPHEGEVRDDSGDLPRLWFQASGSEEPRQRFHLDVMVPSDQARARIEAALAAGGVLVDDGMAPTFTVLADPDGNRVCVCTMEGRDG
ncbi:4a-hydroxytetrahydrobiopterin dehydratase [Nocardioides campestrisoli]|uniref:4a-hydroxytetrahydrobiopterin dehydratase n=1 Tax=Nocardioides campestrisoli TaxID=2736757 RepID=UPI0015E7AB19|nr:4a-hydroxytetrahydrobiopterin dehydratase [Nocardioides campestrisoli]